MILSRSCGWCLCSLKNWVFIELVIWILCLSTVLWVFASEFQNQITHFLFFFPVFSTWQPQSHGFFWINQKMILLHILESIEIGQKPSVLKISCHNFLIQIHFYTSKGMTLGRNQNGKSLQQKKVPSVHLPQLIIYLSPLAWFTTHSSERWALGTHPHCTELWDRPLDDHIQILLPLDLVILETNVGSSMISESRTASFCLQHKLQDSLLGLQPPWKLLGLKKMMPF